MAGSDSELEKTEQASAHRLELAREEGNIPRSRELATCASLIVGACMLWFSGASMVGQLGVMLKESLAFPRAIAFDPELLMEQSGHAAASALWALAPFGAALLVAVIAAPLAVGGWLFCTNSLIPKFERLNPLNGLGNMFSVRALVELGKALAKSALVFGVAWIVFSQQRMAIFALASAPLNSSSTDLAHLLFVCFISIAAALVLIAAIDAPYQIWQHANKLMMTREEVRQEHKEQEGNPEIKARIRSQQREMARRRMMADVPKADVVVTNPTHYAVALKYTESGNSAPIVVAKGSDLVAATIRAIAAEHHIPLLEAPPLARALFRHTEPGDVIPQQLYSAVAQVLAYVFQLRAGTSPALPDAIEVPEGMDIPANENAGDSRA